MSSFTGTTTLTAAGSTAGLPILVGPGTSTGSAYSAGAMYVTALAKQRKQAVCIAAAAR